MLIFFYFLFSTATYIYYFCLTSLYRMFYFYLCTPDSTSHLFYLCLLNYVCRSFMFYFSLLLGKPTIECYFSFVCQGLYLELSCSCFICPMSLLYSHLFIFVSYFLYVEPLFSTFPCSQMILPQSSFFFNIFLWSSLCRTLISYFSFLSRTTRCFMPGCMTFILKNTILCSPKQDMTCRPSLEWPQRWVVLALCVWT